MKLTPEQAMFVNMMRIRVLEAGAADEITDRAEARQTQARTAIGQIAEQSFGIRPEHSDTIYTQHPLMAGVLRQALLKAYEEGLGTAATEVMNAMMQRPG